jgi:FAD/FMN-containing dehydrogenase
MYEVAGLDGETVAVAEQSLEKLAARLAGGVLRPGAAGFDEAIRIWNAMAAKTPALVVQPASTADVRETIAFAAAHGLLLSVKGGGHNVAGTSLADGGLTLDMSRLRTVDVDVAHRRVRVGAGCLLGDVDRATQEHGLATVLGAISETGVAGLTLGGGFGYLTRRFGWTVDNLEEVEIVTADGEVRRASGDEHDDLFWALRGGGGNFGAVTRFTFRVHEVGPEVTGGLMVWDAEAAEDVAALYREVSEASPRELTLMFVMRPAPPNPRLPERWHGRPVATLIVCHTGRGDRAAEDLAAIRAAGQPIADLVGPMAYVDLQSMLNASQPDGMHNYWKSEFVAELSDGVLDGFREHAGRITSPMSQSILFQLGGAVSDHDANTTAFGNRDANHVFFAAGCWAPDSPDAPNVAWARAAWEAIRPYSTGGNYVNVQTADEDDTRMRSAYRQNLDRLARVKAAYDPDNRFRVNRNISPTAVPAR